MSFKLNVLLILENKTNSKLTKSVYQNIFYYKVLQKLRIKKQSKSKNLEDCLKISCLFLILKTSN